MKKQPTSETVVQKGKNTTSKSPLPIKATKGMVDPTSGPQEKRAQKLLEEKWGKDLIAAGWLAIPTTILERQAALGLDAIDINIIFHIAKHWFEAANLPHPSKGSIAAAMRITPRAVQKRIASLEQLGFLRRVERPGVKGSKASQTSLYDLSGLIDKSKPFAVEALQFRAGVRDAKRERLDRKRPRVDGSSLVVDP